MRVLPLASASWKFRDATRRYRFPRDQDALIHLSQLNQGDCRQTGVEIIRD